VNEALEDGIEDIAEAVQAVVDDVELPPIEVHEPDLPREPDRDDRRGRPDPSLGRLDPSQAIGDALNRHRNNPTIALQRMGR
jgi:hypothetical protein